MPTIGTGSVIWHMLYAQPCTRWSGAKLTLAPHPRQDLLAYVPQQLQRQVNMASIKNLMGQELRQLGGHSPQEAQISFIGGSGAGTAGVGAGGQEERNAGRGARRGLHLPCPSQLT